MMLLLKKTFIARVLDLSQILVIMKSRCTSFSCTYLGWKEFGKNDKLSFNKLFYFQQNPKTFPQWQWIEDLLFL